MENIGLGNVHDNFERRSPDYYNECLAELERNPELNNFKGLKFDSVFNNLQYTMSVIRVYLHALGMIFLKE